MLDKIKSFFRAFFALLIPNSVKKYMIGFSTGKVVGFSFLSIVFIWFVFLLSSLLWPYALLRNSAVTNKIQNKITTSVKYIEQGIQNTLEHMPDFVVFVQADGSQKALPLVYLRILTPEEPFSLVVLGSRKGCNLNDFANMHYKQYANALLAICGKGSSQYGNADIESAIKQGDKAAWITPKSYSPLFTISADTKAHSFFAKAYPAEYRYYMAHYAKNLESLDEKVIDSLYVDSVFRLDITDKKLALSSSDTALNSRMQSNEVLFSDMFTRADKSGHRVLVEGSFFNIAIPKSAILMNLKSGFRSLNDELGKGLSKVLSPAVIASIMPNFFLVSLILLPFLVLATALVLSPGAFVLFFGFIGVALILSVLGVVLARFLQGTTGSFAENFKLGVAAVLAVYLYRLVAYVLIAIGVGLGIVPLGFNSVFLHWLAVLLFSAKLGWFIALGYFTILKYSAYREVRAYGINEAVKNTDKKLNKNQAQIKTGLKKGNKIK